MVSWPCCPTIKCGCSGCHGGHAEVVSVLLGIKRDRRMVSVGPVFKLRLYLALECPVLVVCGVLSFLG